MNEKYVVFLGTIIVASLTFVSFTISNNSKNKELELARIDSKEKLSLDRFYKEREWKYKLSEFMIKNKDEIFSNNRDTRMNMKSIMSISFPPEIVKYTFSQLSKLDMSNSEEWEDALSIADRLGKKSVFIQIEKGFPEVVLDLIADTIGEGDFSYTSNDEYIPQNLTRGDIRYFREEDELYAKEVLKDFVDIACAGGYKLDLKIIPFLANKDKNIVGTIEVWLSAKSIKEVTTKGDNCYYE